MTSGVEDSHSFEVNVLNPLLTSTLLWAVIVAQLVDQSLPTPEIRNSNPVIGKIYIERLLSIVLKKRKVRKEEAENGPL